MQGNCQCKEVSYPLFRSLSRTTYHSCFTETQHEAERDQTTEVASPSCADGDDAERQNCEAHRELGGEGLDKDGPDAFERHVGGIKHCVRPGGNRSAGGSRQDPRAEHTRDGCGALISSETKRDVHSCRIRIADCAGKGVSADSGSRSSEQRRTVGAVQEAQKVYQAHESVKEVNIVARKGWSTVSLTA